MRINHFAIQFSVYTQRHGCPGQHSLSSCSAIVRLMNESSKCLRSYTQVASQMSLDARPVLLCLKVQPIDLPVDNKSLPSLSPNIKVTNTRAFIFLKCFLSLSCGNSSFKCNQTRCYTSQLFSFKSIQGRKLRTEKLKWLQTGRERRPLRTSPKQLIIEEQI